MSSPLGRGMYDAKWSIAYPDTLLPHALADFGGGGGLRPEHGRVARRAWVDGMSLACRDSVPLGPRALAHSPGCASAAPWQTLG